MDRKDIKKEYSNGEVTVVWQPAKCIHSEVCVKTLPKVYDPHKKPWIEPEKASSSELKSQIDNCPSGALSYYMNAEGPKSSAPQASVIKAKVAPNGPLLVEGKVEVTHKDGSVKSYEKVTAFCRCGGSSNKPFCDGSHNSNGFQDA